MKKYIFLADAHLKSPQDVEYQSLITFIDEIIIKDSHIDCLFILGDLFDFFISFPQVIFYEHKLLLTRLEELSTRGIKVFYFEGNHDFFLKKLVTMGSTIEIIEKSFDLNLNGKFFVSHGDLINPKDYTHRLLSYMVRNPITYSLAYILPPYLVYHFAHWFSRFSRENISNKKKMTFHVFDGFFEKAVQDGYIGAILGHFHQSRIINKEINGKTFSLHLIGSWKIDRSYAVFDSKKGYLEHLNFKT